jgi:hypothetical protein
VEEIAEGAAGESSRGRLESSDMVVRLLLLLWAVRGWVGLERLSSRVLYLQILVESLGGKAMMASRSTVGSSAKSVSRLASFEEEGRSHFRFHERR